MAINGNLPTLHRAVARGACAGYSARRKHYCEKGGIRTPADLDYLRQFDRECIERNLSPGGSADLLILTWFLAQI
ncbi:triphosphoribosyl-dephospho-CoA synthase [Escherichia coli]